MQIRWVEPSELLQFLPLQEMEIGPVDSEKPLFPQILKHPVDMHGRDAEAIGQLYLRNRKLKSAVSGPAYSLEAPEKLNKEVRHSGSRRSAPDIDDPFPEDCRVDQCFPPKRRSHVRALSVQLPQSIMRNEAELTRRERYEIMVHDLEVEALEIGNLTGNMQ